MDALTLLQRRRSSKKFSPVAPTNEQIAQILQAGLRAPDHGKLKPYRFAVIQGEAIQAFETALVAAVAELNLGEERVAKAQKLARRAPLTIAVMTHPDLDCAKVPEWEQDLCAGAATYAIQLAANALGFDNCWITGKWIDGSQLRAFLGCEAQEKIIALIQIGAPIDSDAIAIAPQAESLDGFVRYL